MRSKKLARHLKKAFECNLEEEAFPQLLSWAQQLPEGPERNTVCGLLEGLPELFNQIEQSYTQNDERVDMAHRSLEVSSNELTELNKNLMSLNQTFDAMVNSLGQGFFLFSQQGKVLSTYSKACESLLECLPSGHLITEIFKVPSEKHASFLDWCSMLFEEILEFEELAVLGPKFYRHSQGRIVALEYKPVRSKSGAIEAVVVIATDRTDEVEANRKAHELQAYATLVVSILKDRPRFSQFVRHSREFFKEMRETLKIENFSEDSLNMVKRHLHTLKGAAATFGMEQIKDRTHQVETEIANYHGLSVLQQFLRSAVGELEDRFENLLLENKEVIGDIFQGASSTREVTVDCLEDFATKLKAFGAEEGLYQSFVEGILCVPLWDNFEQFNPVIEATAKTTGKRVGPIVCLGDNPPLYPEAYENVWESLSHLFRNLVDHGIESPSVRKGLGKSEAGQIFIRCRELEIQGQRHFEVRISDDGKGIDPENIRRKLLSKRDPSANNLTREELLNRIFEPGFSTAAIVTEISGRGVGLDAVRSAIENMQGTVSVESSIGKGTTFCVVLPLIQRPGMVKLLVAA